MEALLNNLIKAVSWSILHSLWQGAVIFALLLPTQLKAFRLNAKLKYNLAYTANCLIFLSFIFTFLSAFEWPAAQQIQQVSLIQPVLSTPLFQLGYIEKLFPYLACLYTIGVAIQATLMYQGYRKVQRLKKAAHLEIPKEWRVLFATLVVKMNISRNVKFYLSDRVSIPLIIGYLKPVVLFPVALVSQLDMAQTEAILIHELSHIRRNDYLFNVIKTMIDTLLFFNPFIWLTGKFIVIERENACDDLVVQLTNQPLKYAHALLTLELVTDKSRPALALAATGKSQHLYHRIKRITDMKTNHMNSKQKLIALSLTIATVFSLAWISPAKKQNTLKNGQEVLKQHNSSELPKAVTDTGKKAVKKSIQTESTTNPKTAVLTLTDKQQLEIVLKSDSDAAKEELVLSPNTKKAIDNFTGNVLTLVTTDQENKEKIAKLQQETKASGVKLNQEFDSPQQKKVWTQLSEEAKAKYSSPEGKKNFKKLLAGTTASTIGSVIYTADNSIAGLMLADVPSDKTDQKKPELVIDKTVQVKDLEAVKNANNVELVVTGRPYKKEPVTVTGKPTRYNNIELAVTGRPYKKEPVTVTGKPTKGNNVELVVTGRPLDKAENIKRTPAYLKLKKKFDQDVAELEKKNDNK